MDQTQLPNQVLDDEGDPTEIVRQALRILRTGRWWILLTALGTTVSAVLVLSILPNKYKSEATILVVEQQIPQNLVAPLSTATVAQKVQLMTTEVLSRARLLQIVTETGIYAEQKKLLPDAAVEMIRKAIDITPVDPARDGAYNAFAISFTANSPAMAQEVTRKLSSLFIERHSERQVSRANSTTNFLNERLAEKRKRAADLEQRIREFKTQHVGELPDDRVSNESRMAEARTQHQNTVANLSRSRQQRIIWESMLSGNLNARSTRLKSERASLLARFTPKHPEVVRKDEEIAQVDRLIANLQLGAATTEEQLTRFASSDPIVAQLQGQLEANRLEVENLSKEQKRLEGMMADSQRRLSAAPVREQQLASMVREMESLNQEILNIEKMDQQSGVSAEMEKKQQGEQFRQLDSASLPLKPLSPARFKLSAAAAFGGIALGFVLAFLIDLRKSCFQTERQIRRKFSPPLVLSVPLLPTPRETRRRTWITGFEWVAGSLVAAAMLAVELYVYRHP